MHFGFLYLEKVSTPSGFIQGECPGQSYPDYHQLLGYDLSLIETSRRHFQLGKADPTTIFTHTKLGYRVKRPRHH